MPPTEHCIVCHDTGTVERTRRSPRGEHMETVEIVCPYCEGGKVEPKCEHCGLGRAALTTPGPDGCGPWVYCRDCAREELAKYDARREPQAQWLPWEVRDRDGLRAALASEAAA